MAGALCRKCGIILDPALRAAGDSYHVHCGPTKAFAIEFDEPTPTPGLANTAHALRLREDVIDVIHWANRNSARSLQKELGASEISECLRRLGYRVANLPGTGNEGDPWPAIVGTGIHMWLEEAFTRFEEVHRLGRWFTEMTVRPHEGVLGHTDNYDAETFTVIDWKSKGTEEMREIRKGIVTFDDHIEQVSLYGRGHIEAGRRVDHVALFFLPRGGWLSGAYVWSQPYNPAIAEAALDRRNRVEAGIRYYDVINKPENWQKFPATPSKACSWCPWFNGSLTAADDRGCPGK